MAVCFGVSSACVGWARQAVSQSLFSLTPLVCVHLDSMIQPQLKDDKPCYIFFRLDERNAHQNYLWVFMSYTPDHAKVYTLPAAVPCLSFPRVHTHTHCNKCDCVSECEQGKSASFELRIYALSLCR